ncbi:histidine phosphatase family protein [Colwellia sp. MT41]|uniref:Phosphoglycerate mutase n=1 Tax=Colwellia marinimaniae TaxID=1513592 RepID=A0ABQ0MWS3_9GAMM|nr:MULTISPECIES: phosphoglycerate mutase family protein [Colwellia]ALO33547.1 histidine phosphatase family protein [Colwellia sp. MT41]GAW96819.1 phosphoglycerate mutase [Colwellia marinimaniae]
MKKFSLIIAGVLLLQPCLANDNFTLYLVRHAEKQADDKKPRLTQCGQARAKQLATLLSTAKIKAIYSTSYQRTMLTAAPLAKQQHVAIKHYNPKQLEQFALHLKQSKKNALIIGHSNTTPQLTQLLSDEKVAALSEDNYQTLYQIQFVDKQAILTKFMQPLVCN